MRLLILSIVTLILCNCSGHRGTTIHSIKQLNIESRVPNPNPKLKTNTSHFAAFEYSHLQNRSYQKTSKEIHTSSNSLARPEQKNNTKHTIHKNSNQFIISRTLDGDFFVSFQWSTNDLSSFEFESGHLSVGVRHDLKALSFNSEIKVGASHVHYEVLKDILYEETRCCKNQSSLDTTITTVTKENVKDIGEFNALEYSISSTVLLNQIFSPYLFFELGARNLNQEYFIESFSYRIYGVGVKYDITEHGFAYTHYSLIDYEKYYSPLLELGLGISW